MSLSFSQHLQRWLLPGLLLIFTFEAEAQRTLHVPADYGTVQAAVDAASDGDTVLVAPGIYRENIDVLDKGLTLTSGATHISGAAATILEGQTSAPTVLFHIDNPSLAPPRVVLNGFTITHALGIATDENNTGNGAVLNESDATVSHNLVLENPGCGIVAGYADVYDNTITSSSVGSCGQVPLIMGCSYPYQVNTCLYSTFISPSAPLTMLANGTVTGNRIVNNVSHATGGYSAFAGIGATLQNNVFAGNSAEKGPVYFGWLVALTLTQNLVVNNTSTDPLASGIAMTGPILGPLVMVNNTVESPSSSARALDFDAYMESQTISNNLFIGTQAGQAVRCYYEEENNSGIPLDTPPATAIFSHNDVFAPGTPQSYTCGNASQTAGNLSADPRFIAPAAGDFHVQRASPVVAAGDIDAPMLPPLDLDGRNRTVCGTIDMGVYEIHPQPAITVTSSSNPSVGGTPVTFTATVVPNCNTPTGTVTFLDGSAVLGTATLNQGAAGSLTTSSLIAGTHTITVTYGGDGNFDPSVSGPFTQVVTGQPTVTTLQVSPNPANPFAPVLLSSTVTGAGAVPTGSVTWTANGTPVATAPLSSGGAASATVTSLGAGSYTIVAAYSADIHFAPSTSAPVVEVVNGAATAMAVSGSPNPATAVQTVTLTAVVQSLAGGGMPGGSVTFSEGSAVLGTAVLDAHGQGSVTVGPLAIGQHLITARYAGGALFNAASASFTEAVTAVPSTVTLTAAPNPANQGQSVSLVATVAAANATATGEVTFLDGGVPLGVAAIDASGTARLNTASLAVGTHTLTAVYAGDGTVAKSTSPVVQEVVLAYDFSLTPPTAAVTLPAGDWTNVVLTLTPVGGFDDTVALSCTGLPAHAQCVFDSGNTVPLANGSRQVTLTVNTCDIYHFGPKAALRHRGGGTHRWGAVIAALLLPGLALWRGRKRLAMVSCLLVIVAGGLHGCSAKQPADTAPGTYPVTVTATETNSPNLQHTATLTLTVH